ncbi:VOC family protein [Marinivivus vitaminiproducens]|uniref:VOC family protein n=1 Tax=Marinivivus vitaminiproducens TaxID=3035935 RepID=UPI0027A2EBD0|nr:VOC family protein [Geminicoccaceae bacterium SCSIO 64248]
MNYPEAPMTGVIPYLSVEGASDAAALYQKAFGATEIFRMPSDDGKTLMHCHLLINQGSFMLSDCCAEAGHERPGGFVMHLQVDDSEAWWQRALDAGLEVTMPLELQFWGDIFGQVRDRFGVTWSIASKPKA